MSTKEFSSSLRAVQSAGTVGDSPLFENNRPHTTNAKSGNVFWKDFMYNVKKRKQSLLRLREAALESSTSLSVLKKSLVDVRQDTLSLVEDALELEYRTRISESRSTKRGKPPRLPPMSSYNKIEEKEDAIALSEIIYDADDLFSIPNIRVMLPMNFPNKRNPFMLGKTIDELAIVVPPHPEAGNVDEELKVLELLRYKRASRALLRAESQVLNRLPIDLFALERLLTKITDDSNVENLIRCVYTLIENDRKVLQSDVLPNLSSLQSPVFQVEGYDLLRKLNNFHGVIPMRVDVQITIRQYLQGCFFEHLADPASAFLVEWISIVLGSSKSLSASNPNRNTNEIIETAFSPSRNESIATTYPSHSLVSTSIETFNGDVSLFKQPFAIAKIDEDLASDVNSQSYDKTHENIQPIFKSKKKSKVKILSPPASPTLKNRATSPSSPPSMPLSSSKEVHKQSTNAAVTQVKSSRNKIDLKKMGEDKEEFENLNVKKKIRTEVERAIRDLALYRKPGNEDDTAGISTMESLNSVRYELTKIQQELLRKQVLDPRHYTLNSVDSIVHANRGLTVPDINAFSPFENKQSTSKRDSQPVEIASKTFVLEYMEEKLPLLMSVVLHNETNWLYCSVCISYEDSIKFGFQFEQKSYFASFSDQTPFTLYFIEISPLMFSKLTDYTCRELQTAKSDLRKRILQNIFGQLENFTKHEPIPLGKLSLVVDRSLYQQKLVEENILLEMTISRNIDCNGILFHSNVLAGVLGTAGTSLSAAMKNMGPVELFVHDNELEILLIAQHGLYLSAKEKWMSMKTVAQWLAGRMKVRKVLGVSQLLATQKRATLDNNIPNLKSDDLSLTANPEVVANTTMLMLEITLERHIDLSSAIIENWKSRNLPRLLGLECLLRACQDMDVLIIEVQLTIPSKQAYKKLSSDQNKASKASHQQDLIDLEDFSEDDEYEYDDGKPVIIPLTYRLTRAELLIFGNIEYSENKKAGLSNAQNSNNEKKVAHPDQLIWNVLNRLKVTFKGSKIDPYRSSCSALEPDNWSMTYQRSLIRDVKTVSQTVLIVRISTIGNESLVEGEPVDTTNKLKLENKIICENELAEFVNAEGWNVELLDYSRRQELMHILLDKLKIVCEQGVSRLELYTYVETRMITIMKSAVGTELEQELGSVEINSHHTLSDLRIILKHEFDVDEVPIQYRFLYKGMVCSLRQETFRRAWECLPVCWISPKLVVQVDMGVETDDIAQKRKKEGNIKKDSSAFRLGKSQRRVPGKHIPLPVPTLCLVEERKSFIYLLHDSKEFFVPGDIVRVGNVRGRDYIVTATENSDKDLPPNTKMLEIEPEYDLIHEPDFNTPISQNFPHPTKNVGMYCTIWDQKIRVLPTKQEKGFDYEVPDTIQKLLPHIAPTISGPLQALPLPSQVVVPQSKTGNLVKEKNIDADDEHDDDSTLTMGTANQSPPKLSKKQSMKGLGMRIFVDCWIWKCIPAKEDPRPKWKQLYDDGEINYTYEFFTSGEYFQHFRVKAMYAYLEVLCTDARCTELTYGSQRVAEMKSIPLEYYVKLIYDKMTDWAPTYKRGIERTKFIKLVRDVIGFPDLKRPARVAQLDMLFQKLVKTSYGIVQKYLTYPGFCQLIKDVAIMRFPSRKKEETNENSNLIPDEVQSQLNEDRKLKKKPPNDDALVDIANDDASAMTDDISTIASEPENIPKKMKKQVSKSRDVARSGDDNNSQGGNSVNNADSAHVQYAYQKFVLDYLMMYPTWYEIVWKDAKIMAMKKEALKFCATTRIAAVFRGYHYKRKYRFIMKQIICLQSHARRKLHAKFVLRMILMLREDWLFRIRYHQSVKIQSIIRRFLKRCWYEHVLEQIKKQQVLLCKARRQKYKKNHENLKKRLMYAEVQKMNGILVLIKVYRKDPRNYTKDFGIIIEAYIPQSQSIYKFPLEDAELRSYMAILLEKESVTVGEILDKHNIRNLIACRLIVHRASQKHAVPIVIFSKHALGQRGVKSVTRAKRIQGEMFVCKIFETVEELVVQLYHRHTCKIFTCNIETEELRKWIKDDCSLQLARDRLNRSKMLSSDSNMNDGEKSAMPVNEENLEKLNVENDMAIIEDPPILHPSNKNHYYAWILNHLVIDTRKGRFQVVFANQLEKSRKLEMIIKIQSQWRRALVRPIIIRKLDALMLKVKSEPYDGAPIYYLNRFTGASNWNKPKLLGIYDIPTQPSRRWVPIHYEHNGVPSIYYVNPFTGKYTYMMPDQAAKIIQSLVRNHLLKVISMPRDSFSKAAKIFMSSGKLYHQYQEGETRRLAHVINYALVTHVVDLNEEYAKEVYREAVELSEANPLVTRAYAFYLMATCEAPIGLNRDRAQILLGDAQRRDPEIAKFQFAYSLYQFACLRQPNNPKTLVNLALVQCILYTKNFTGEKLLRRALALAPFEERVMEIWKFLKDRFPERHIMYNPMSRIHKMQIAANGKKRTIHGRQVVESNQWSGWCYVEDDIYQVSKIHKGIPYWYNPADGSETSDMPNFMEQWEIRKTRSFFQVEEYGLEQYYDPLTSDYFQYHPLTNTYS